VMLRGRWFPEDVLKKDLVTAVEASRAANLN
jgi:hypothetical protein